MSVRRIRSACSSRNSETGAAGASFRRSTGMPTLSKLRSSFLARTDVGEGAGAAARRVAFRGAVALNFAAVLGAAALGASAASRDCRPAVETLGSDSVTSGGRAGRRRSQKIDAAAPTRKKTRIGQTAGPARGSAGRFTPGSRARGLPAFGGFPRGPTSLLE